MLANLFLLATSLVASPVVENTNTRDDKAVAEQNSEDISVWPLYGLNKKRESTHHYIAWPLITWAKYEEDAATNGEGYSWMVFPLFASVSRAREEQTFILPPLFSYAKSEKFTRLRAPWPLFEYINSDIFSRVSIWPFYEQTTDKTTNNTKHKILLGIVSW